MRQPKLLKCPKCKEEIEDLWFEAKVEHSGYFRLDKNENEEWDTENYGDWNDLKFFCNECGELLFINQDEALEFLRGKD
jgi:hypothetical protein